MGFSNSIYIASSVKAHSKFAARDAMFSLSGCRSGR
jgi:hypothetical protein